MKLYTESVNKLANQLERRSNSHSLKEELKRANEEHTRKENADGLLGSHRSRNGEHYSELLADWNEEFPVRIRKADMKYGNKNLIIDENRRDTYKQFHPSTYANESSLLSNFGGERKQLLAVGLHAEHGYARSLARFAANLGPIVWKVASKKIEKALPPGTKFAPGIVGENDPSPPPSLFFPPKNPRHISGVETSSSPGQDDV